MISSLVRKGKASARRLGANTIRDQVAKATGSKRLASAAAAAFEAGTAGRIYDANMQTEDTEGRKSKGGYRNESAHEIAVRKDKERAAKRPSNIRNMMLIYIYCRTQLTLFDTHSIRRRVLVIRRRLVI